MLFAGANELAREDANVFLGLLCLRGIALGAAVGLDDEGFGFGFGKLHVGNITVDFAGVLSD